MRGPPSTGGRLTREREDPRATSACVASGREAGARRETLSCAPAGSVSLVWFRFCSLLLGRALTQVLLCAYSSSSTVDIETFLLAICTLEKACFDETLGHGRGRLRREESHLRAVVARMSLRNSLRVDLREAPDSSSLAHSHLAAAEVSSNSRALR